MEKYLIVIEKAVGNYSAYSPDVPGCVTTGRTIEATLDNMRKALSDHLELLAADGDALPAARGLEYHLQSDEQLRRGADVVLAHIAFDLPALQSA